MAVLDSHEKNKTLKNIIEEFAIYHITPINIVIVFNLVFILIFFSQPVYILLLNLFFLFFSTFRFGFHLADILDKRNIKYKKLIENKFNLEKEVLVIIATDPKRFDFFITAFFPSIENYVVLLISYLDLRFGKGEYSILHTRSQYEIIKSIQNPKVKTVYFYGHGSRRYFKNNEMYFDYELLNLIKDKKDKVIQLTCCMDKNLGCAADFVLEGEQKQKYQAGRYVNKDTRDFIFFYIYDLVENSIFPNEETAKKEFFKKVDEVKNSI